MPSNCSCIRNNYNFLLRSYEHGKLLYEDMSDWMCEYTEPATYDVFIKRSDGSYPTTPISLKIDTTNVINSDDVDVALQDGIYCFKTISCGKTYEKVKAITRKLDCSLDHLIAQGVNIPEYRKIAEIAEKYIAAIHYNAERGFLEEAEFYYNLARKELSCISCNC